MSMKAHLPNKLGAVDIDDLRLYPLKYREGTRSLVKPFHPSDLIADIDDGSSPDSPFVVGRQGTHSLSSSFTQNGLFTQQRSVCCLVQILFVWTRFFYSVRSSFAGTLSQIEGFHTCPLSPAVPSLFIFLFSFCLCHLCLPSSLCFVRSPSSLCCVPLGTDDFPWPLPTTSYATYREGQVTILEHSAVDVVSY